MSGLAGRVARLMIGFYPRRWRRRYEEELLVLLEEHPSTPRKVANLARGAVGTHLDPGYRREGITISRPDSALRTTAHVAAFAVPVILIVTPGKKVVFDYASTSRPGSMNVPLPTRAVMLRDGNILISDQFNDEVIEINAHKRIVFAEGKIHVDGNGFNQLNAPTTPRSSAATPA